MCNDHAEIYLIFHKTQNVLILWIIILLLQNLQLQGSGLGPFLYVVMINDLVTNGLLLHKFMDDSTITDTTDNPAESKMQDASDNVVQWTEENNTRINGVKTKEMIITFQNNPPPIPPLNINGTVIERVKSSKLLRIIICDDLKWHLDVDSICSKASRHIHFLSGMIWEGASGTCPVVY